MDVPIGWCSFSLSTWQFLRARDKVCDDKAKMRIGKIYIQ